ncbi:MAG TPA: GGDEF domain-containing protein, partial [Mollicutes bacterium]|nr:GGDEF domain-containing protein [Mollicutes bacterium]
ENKKIKKDLSLFNIKRSIIFGVLVIIFNFFNVILFKDSSIVVKSRDYFLFFNIITLIFIVYLSLNIENKKNDKDYLKLSKLLYVFFIIITLNSYFPYLLTLDINKQFFYILALLILLFASGPLLNLKDILICLLFSNLFPAYLIISGSNDYSFIRVLLFISLFLIIFTQIIYYNFYNYFIKLNYFEKSKNKLIKQAQTDKLTSLLNRHGIEEKLKNLNKVNNIALIIIDIDFFKDYNDKFGHIEGDICLKKVAHTIKNSTKKETDFVARFGGEEFIVILNNVNKSNVINITKRILKNIENLKIDSANQKISCFVTASAGVSFKDKKDKFHYLKLIDEADKQLLKVKRSKRNKISFENKIINT